MRKVIVLVVGLACSGCASSSGRMQQEAGDHQACAGELRMNYPAEYRKFNYEECRRAMAYERHQPSGGTASSSTMDAAIMAGALASQRGR